MASENSKLAVLERFTTLPPELRLQSVVSLEPSELLTMVLSEDTCDLIGPIWAEHRSIIPVRMKPRYQHVAYWCSLPSDLHQLKQTAAHIWPRGTKTLNDLDVGADYYELVILEMVHKSTKQAALELGRQIWQGQLHQPVLCAEALVDLLLCSGSFLSFGTYGLVSTLDESVKRLSKLSLEKRTAIKQTLYQLSLTFLVFDDVPRLPANMPTHHAEQFTSTDAPDHLAVPDVICLLTGARWCYGHGMQLYGKCCFESFCRDSPRIRPMLYAPYWYPATTGPRPLRVELDYERDEQSSTLVCTMDTTLLNQQQLEVFKYGFAIWDALHLGEESDWEACEEVLGHKNRAFGRKYVWRGHSA